MNKGTKLFILSIVFVILIIIGYRYNQFYSEKQFTLHIDSSCNPTSQSCFQITCTSGDIACDPSPYEKVDILDKNAPTCLEEHSCTNFSCNGISDCAITYCSTDTLEAGENCTTTPQ